MIGEKHLHLDKISLHFIVRSVRWNEHENMRNLLSRFVKDVILRKKGCSSKYNPSPARIHTTDYEFSLST